MDRVRLVAMDLCLVGGVGDLFEEAKIKIKSNRIKFYMYLSVILSVIDG